MAIGNRRRILCKLLLAVVALFVSLALCEAVARYGRMAPELIPIGVSSKDSVFRRSRNPLLSYELKPNYDNPDADVKFDHPKTNSHGQRDVERQFHKPAGVKRILLLGDSVVVGFGIREIDQLMSRQLEFLFEDKQVEVLNMAVSGYCTRAEIELLRTKGVRYAPDLVILVFVENDFHNFNREANRISGIRRPAFANFLYGASYAFRMACLKLDLFGFRMETDPARWNQYATGDDNVNEGLTLFRGLAEQHQFEAVVAVWPTFQNSGIRHNDVMLMPNSEQLIVARLAHSHGLPCWDLLPSFQRHWSSLDDRPSPRTYYTVGDEMHPSVVGNRVAAEILKQLVDQHELLANTPGLKTIQPRATQGDHAALAAARSLGNVTSDYSAVKYNQAKELIKVGDHDKALGLLREVLESSDQHDVDCHVDIGFLLAEKGELEKAIDHYRVAIEASPGNHFAHLNLGNARRQQGNTQEAVKHYEQAVRLRPEMFEARYNLGTTLASNDRFVKALEHLQIAHDLRPDDQRATTRLAQVHFMLGKSLTDKNLLQQATKHLAEACQLAPNNPNVFNSYGIALIKMGKKNQAIEAFSRALQLQPDHPHARQNLEKARQS